MAAPTIFLAAATAMKAIGGIAQANATAAALKQQAQGERYNAEVARQQADQALDVSTAQQIVLQRQARQEAGTRRAAAAQSGVGFGGSTRDILDRSDTLGELDRLNVAYEGALRARGYNTQADLDEFNARAYKAQAKTTKRLGIFGAVGTTLAGGYKASQRTTVSGTT